jgi:hypothetical protein
VLKYTTDDTVHHVIVPPADRGLFADYAGSRCRVWTYPDCCRAAMSLCP